jgi:hypothetical protein
MCIWRFVVVCAAGACVMPKPAGYTGAPGGSPGPTAGRPRTLADCDRPGLEWKTGRKTNYESYPAPGSEECVAYNGCTWAGQFAACEGKKPEAWVASHDIASMSPDFVRYKLHDVCIRSGAGAGARTMIVTVLDTCADSDCNGCCTQNRGSADALIDLEKATNARWGLPDGDVTWADLGPTRTAGCQ